MSGVSDGAPAGADLAALEGELVNLLVEYEILRAAWPKVRRAIDRAKVCREMDATARRIVEIEKKIATAEARSLSDAAVQLRRVSARLEYGDETSRAMLASALAVVEATTGP